MDKKTFGHLIVKQNIFKKKTLKYYFVNKNT